LNAGIVLEELRRYDDAKHAYEEAMQIFDAEGEPEHEAEALRGLERVKMYE
jgi:hypothetical protein